MTTTQTYLVVWRADHDNFLQSAVDIGILDPQQMTNDEWVEAAADVEDYEGSVLEDGYDLILVCPMPEVFYDQ
jgi:hypothetical protein